MKLRQFMISFALLPALLAAAAAQDKKAGDNAAAEWQRLQSANGEFSVEMPAKYVYFYDKQGFTLSPAGKTYDYREMQLINSSTDKTVMSLEIYEVSKPKKYLEAIMNQDHLEGIETEETPPGFNIKQIELTKAPSIRGENIEISHFTKYIASKTHIYIVTVSNRGKKSEASARFLSSIRLQTNKVEEVDGVGVIDISRLTPVTIQQIGTTETDGAAGTAPKPADPGQRPVKNPTALIVVTKPRPTFGNLSRRSGFSGGMRLRLTFSGDGRISKIVLLSVLTEDLTKNSFFAAMRVKFIPEEKDGVITTISRSIEYNFMLY